MSAILNLGGKVAVITGAASGIGRQTATLFHALGARLVLTDIDSAGLAAFAEELGGDVLTATHDVTSETAWTAVFGQVDAAFGELDILINNAGIMVSKPFAEAGIDVLRRQMQINVEGVVFQPPHDSGMFQAHSCYRGRWATAHYRFHHHYGRSIPAGRAGTASPHRRRAN